MDDALKKIDELFIFLTTCHNNTADIEENYNYLIALDKLSEIKHLVCVAK